MKYKNNLEKATNLAEELFLKFKQLDFKCKHLMIKASDLSSFEFLFIVDESAYLSAARKNAYNEIRNRKKAINSEEFRFECLIMPENNGIDFSLIISEGFTLKYEPKSC